jgi:hypothetical protein
MDMLVQLLELPLGLFMLLPLVLLGLVFGLSRMSVSLLHVATCVCVCVADQMQLAECDLRWARLPTFFEGAWTELLARISLLCHVAFKHSKKTILTAFLLLFSTAFLIAQAATKLSLLQRHSTTPSDSSAILLFSFHITAGGSA